MSENLLQNKRIFLIGLLFITLIGAMSMENFVGDIESATSEGNAIEIIHENINKLEEKLVFTGYIIEENQNLFYVKPNDWNELSTQERQTALMSASRIVLFDKRIDCDFKTLREEQIRTKIYSSLNKDELLAHIAIREILNKKGKIKRTKKFSDAYKFNDASSEYYGNQEIEIDAVIEKENEETYE